MYANSKLFLTKYANPKLEYTMYAQPEPRHKSKVGLKSKSSN